MRSRKASIARSVFPLLVQGEAERDQDKAEQDQPLLQFAEDQIQGAGGEQQQKHRLPRRLPDDGQQAAPLAPGQGIGAVRGEAVGGGGGRQPLRGVIRRVGHQSTGLAT